MKGLVFFSSARLQTKDSNLIILQLYSIVCVLLCAQFGPLSERYEVTTGPGAPEQCKAPSTMCKSPSCVVVSWEVGTTSFPPLPPKNEFAHNCIIIKLHFQFVH